MILIRLSLLAGLFGLIFLFSKFVFSDRSIIFSCFLTVVIINFFQLEPSGILSPDGRMWWAVASGTTSDMGWILYRPKLYVWFLSLFNSLEWVPIGQWALRTLTLVFVWLLGRHLKWKSVTTAFVILIFGLNSMGVQEQSQVLDTTLFSLMVLSSLYFFMVAHKKGGLWIWAYGLSAGLCTLTRQVADPFLFFGFVLLVVKHRPQWKDLSISFLTFILIGWAALWINWVKYDIPKRTVALGVNVFTHSAYYNWQLPNSGEKKLIGDITKKPVSEGILWNSHYTEPINWYANAIPHQYQRLLEERGMTRLESDAFLKNEYVNWVINNKTQFMVSVVNELQRLILRAHEYGPQSMLPEPLQKSIPLVRMERTLIHFPIWFLLILSLVAFISRPQRFSYCPFLIGAGYLVMMASVQVGFTRYTLPLLPILYLSFGYVITSLFKTPIQWKILEPVKGKPHLIFLKKPPKVLNKRRF